MLRVVDICSFCFVLQFLLIVCCCLEIIPKESNHSDIQMGSEELSHTQIARTNRKSTFDFPTGAVATAPPLQLANLESDSDPNSNVFQKLTIKPKKILYSWWMPNMTMATTILVTQTAATVDNESSVPSDSSVPNNQDSSTSEKHFPKLKPTFPHTKPSFPIEDNKFPQGTSTRSPNLLYIGRDKVKETLASAAAGIGSLVVHAAENVGTLAIGSAGNVGSAAIGKAKRVGSATLNAAGAVGSIASGAAGSLGSVAGSAAGKVYEIIASKFGRRLPSEQEPGLEQENSGGNAGSEAEQEQFDNDNSLAVVNTAGGNIVTLVAMLLSALLVRLC